MLFALLALVSSAAGDDKAQQQAWQAAQQQLPFTLATERPEINFSVLEQQLPQLLALAPLQKQQLWRAVDTCVRADNLLQLPEQALLLALALLLEIPYQPEL